MTILDQVFAPIEHGEGIRIGIVGDSGTGKTHAARQLLAAWLARVPRGIALIHDDVGPCQYAGEQRGFPADLKTQPAAGRAIVFRGANGRGCDPADVAALAWKLSHASVPVLIVLDELERAASAGHWRHAAGCDGGASCSCMLPRAFAWGRRVQLSVAWTTQSAQAAPREALEQSTALFTMHVAGRGARYLDELGYLDGGAAAALAQLPDGMAPPDKRGACLVLRRGAPWDGKLYRL